MSTATRMSPCLVFGSIPNTKQIQVPPQGSGDGRGMAGPPCSPGCRPLILTLRDAGLHVLLVRRGVEPYAAMMALPGGMEIELGLPASLPPPAFLETDALEDQRANRRGLVADVDRRGQFGPGGVEPGRVVAA